VSDNDKQLYVVHAVDTEGPLYQSPKATALRLNELYDLGIDTSADYRALGRVIAAYARGQTPAGGREDEIAHFLSTTEFLSDKAAYAAAVQEATSQDFRHQHADPQGGPYRWSWFVLDNVGTLINPRRRLFGYGQVYVNLREAFTNRDSLELDGFYWHYHQIRKDDHPFIKETNFHACDEYNQILCRYIIEHRHFPAAYRAGYCLERWDANLWLENWLPFDFSNHAPSFDYDQDQRVRDEVDFWLRAPNDWSHYHPDGHDLERPGNLRRTMFRSLCYKTRLYTLTEEDVRQAFVRADSGRPTVLSAFSHDFRRLAPEAEGYHRLVKKVAAEFPGVRWQNATAVAAARAVLGRQPDGGLQLRLWYQDGQVKAESSRPVFGSEPFLALMTDDYRFFHQNFVRLGQTRWAYHLRHPGMIKFIGIGANDPAGFSDTALLVRDGQNFLPVTDTGYWAGSPE